MAPPGQPPPPSMPRDARPNGCGAGPLLLGARRPRSRPLPTPAPTGPTPAATRSPAWACWAAPLVRRVSGRHPICTATLCPPMPTSPEPGDGRCVWWAVLLAVRDQGKESLCFQSPLARQHGLDAIMPDITKIRSKFPHEPLTSADKAALGLLLMLILGYRWYTLTGWTGRFIWAARFRGRLVNTETSYVRPMTNLIAGARLVGSGERRGVARPQDTRKFNCVYGRLPTCGYQDTALKLDVLFQMRAGD